MDTFCEGFLSNKPLQGQAAFKLRPFNHMPAKLFDPMMLWEKQLPHIPRIHNNSDKPFGTVEELT